ncbi:MAG: secondary thiamine-phosphate synthase enzyme YjbQ [Synergistaceae bacterium]|jgi:secondary thiamine-phosphate synthase enzyme|nr:secondary thiamine-phosphate synthase enzyme YjbQ [Synergistaceae bacterium]
MSVHTFTLSTKREGFYDITEKVAEAIAKSGAEEGLCLVFCPHTTAAITINENADPDVPADILKGLAAAYPDSPAFRHGEGNSPAHLKSTCVGASVTLIIEGGRPLLGTWQGVWFCEFDGPRTRHFHVKVLQG